MGLGAKVKGRGHGLIASFSALKIAGTLISATAAELNKLAGVAAGTVTASKAVVVGASKDVDTLDILAPKINGTALGSTAAEIDAQCDASAIGGRRRLIVHTISATPTGAEQDTAIDLPTKGVVLNVWVDVTTAEATGATKTLDVGLLASESGGDTDGFVESISVAATGVKQGALVAGGITLGALFRETVTDSAAATHNRGKPHVLNGTAVSLVYRADSNDWANFRGRIIVDLIDMTGS